MYELFDAHAATLVVVMAALMVTPLHLLATYAFMVWFCLARVVERSGPLGNLYVPLLWAAPSLLVWLARDWLLAEPLSQRWLIGLQLWRVIGALFLVEMARGQLPAVFALPAGIGDIAVSLLAAVVLWRGRGKSVLPAGAVIAVMALGIADFVSAFFFGFFSSIGPQQLFFPEVPNRALLFPTGLIPLFLVPYAIAFHTLSWLTLRRQRQDRTRGAPQWVAGNAA